uniref:Uncharacterized protein n=1 Tax=Melopsittacus undulatus TaxID=13146 RepID=A0A8C6JZD5_MELUD
QKTLILNPKCNPEIYIDRVSMIVTESVIVHHDNKTSLMKKTHVVVWLVDYKFIADVEISVNFTHREVEEKCRQELEQWEKRQKELEDEKRKKWKAEREAQEKQNEDEQTRRRQHLEELEAEKVKLELLHKKHQIAIEDQLQKEEKAWRDKMMQHEELIMKPQLQMEDDKNALEKQKAKERQHLTEQQNTAAVKIQARFRSFLVHKKYAPILKQWKDEVKKKQKILEETEREMKEKEEKMKMQMAENWQKKEEEKKRQEILERQEYLEQVRRCEDYEKKKESLALKREKQLQIRREEQRKQGQKKSKTVMSESTEKKKGNINNHKQTENTKVVGEQEEEEIEEEGEGKQAEMMDEKTYWIIPAQRTLTLTSNMLGCEKEHFFQVNNESIYKNSVTHIGETYPQTRDLNQASNSHTSTNESVNFGTNNMVESKASNICSSPPVVQPDGSEKEVKDHVSQSEARKKTVFLMEDANEVRETSDKIQDSTECSSSIILPDDIEKKRINWMNTCKSWSKIHEENQRKKAAEKKGPRKSSFSKMPKMPPLSIEKILHSSPWCTPKQVTTLTLEDLPACSLSTLSECSNLQFLTLRRCGLVALEGLSSCKDLKYINVEENDIQTIDCENLENLSILILSKNHLSSVCGLDDCINLQNLELSYNRITRIGGLESLKNLQQLIVDHNQLISTKGLYEAPTLIHLDCSFNHLTQVEGIENCGLLQILKLQGNNLQEFPRLENHVLLRELYLDDNSFSTMRMLSLYWLPLLQILLLSQNRLTELVPLNSFVSLEKLDIKNNCLSDLEGVISWLSGCHKLKDLSLSGNPLLQERNWRPFFCKVLPSLQLLDGEILNCNTLPTTERIKKSESSTFMELCQLQIEENVLLKKKAAELRYRTAGSFLLLGQCWYFNQLMKLSIKHRYAHEYGELYITDRDGPEALQNHLKQTSTGCLQENNLFIMGATENKQDLLDPSKRWIATGHTQATFINSSIPVHRKENKEHQKVKETSTESCINYSGESKGNNNMSAELMLQQSAFWKGFLLRKKLASALAAVKSNEVEDDYEEINVDDFTFSEAALEKEWLTLDSTRFPSKTLLLSNQLYWPKVTCHRNFLLFSLYSFLKDIKLLSSPRGFKDISTAQLMLKRARKMKPKKYSNKNLENVIFYFMIVYILSHCFQASPVSREDTDLDLVSMASGSALTENREKNKQAHRHSARSSSKLQFF